MAQVTVEVKIGNRVFEKEFLCDGTDEDECLDDIVRRDDFVDWATEIVGDRITVKEAQYDEVEEEDNTSDEEEEDE